jgi:hypothetical protein
MIAKRANVRPIPQITSTAGSAADCSAAFKPKAVRVAKKMTTD